ncbi:D-alanyl-lipoteichoic acid biosynthesis protein DltD [Lapidilactobacillus bayanensis]|uniref:D-alanyl-lipoteichoic acid biosynthesis protein DltD n=1 Tax=Lapidilactobacillus bayanensis TaxID=2485998 RepID=UPI0013DDD0FA|nr:D-alanyl-lipoteichoic acid biosynthesis protein DltD [Lapidilactobacillus bayanensis]
MKSAKKLGLIFGPVVIAAALVWGILLLPLNHRRVTNTELNHSAVSLSTNVYHGTMLKQAAFAKDYVPFLGSSELLRMDPLHPSVLAAKYHRPYQPFLLGSAGSQSLNHFFALQGVHRQLRGKKIVFIISPQWFTKHGQAPDAFSYFYSPLQAIDWLLTAKDTTSTRYAAKRLLSMPSGESSTVLAHALQKIAAGEKISHSERLFLEYRRQMLRNEDALFSKIKLDRRWQHVQKVERLLPAEDSNQLLTTTAIHLAQKHTNNNNLGIDNHFYAQRLRGSRINALRGSQKHFDYRCSPEYSDLELLLSEFKQMHTNVLFIIPPINQKWSHYTGLSLPMLRQTADKLAYQLNSQGFNHVLDMTSNSHQKYMMEDTIHLGWLGWLKMDEVVKPFLTQPQAQPNYHLNNYFYTKKWQQTLFSKEGGHS